MSFSPILMFFVRDGSVKQQQRPDEKRDNFDEFVSAMWTKNGTTGKMANPQSFLKNTLDTSKPG